MWVRQVECELSSVCTSRCVSHLSRLNRDKECDDWKKSHNAALFCSGAVFKVPSCVCQLLFKPSCDYYTVCDACGAEAAMAPLVCFICAKKHNICFM